MTTQTIAPTKTSEKTTTPTPNTNGTVKEHSPLKADSTPTRAQFPEFPPRCDMQNFATLYETGYIDPLKRHFGAQDTTLLYGEVPVGTDLSIRLGLRIPDLIIAFDCDPARVIDRQGYDITEQGKPPDFVLEIASATTGRIDYTDKRIDYERCRIPEYWRFDATGGRYHDVGLAGDRLVNGRYEPIPIEWDEDGVGRGYSEVLGLYLCWNDRKLLWYDPVTQRYLTSYDEEVNRADMAEERAEREVAARQRADNRAERAEERADREADARRQADERADREADARRQADERANREADARQRESNRADREADARQNAEAELRRLQERLGRLGEDE